MCKSCDWEKAQRLAEAVVGTTDQINEQRWHDGGAMDFAAGVAGRAASIAEWIEKERHVTDKQVIALKNMLAGAERWLEG